MAHSAAVAVMLTVFKQRRATGTHTFVFVAACAQLIAATIYSPGWVTVPFRMGYTMLVILFPFVMTALPQPTAMMPLGTLIGSRISFGGVCSVSTECMSVR